jgi:hypothetical protein
LNSNLGHFGCFTFSLFRLENRVYLSCDVRVVGAAWCAVMRIMAGVGDLVQKTGDSRIGQVLGGQMIKRSSDAVCGLHHARGDEEHQFLGEASKPRSAVYQWFVLKTTGMVSSKLTSKPVATFSWLSLKTKVVAGFPVWASKPAATVW